MRLLFLCALALVVAGVAVASIPDSSGVIHGCYKTSGGGPQQAQGSLRVIDTDAGQLCVSGEAPLNWNQTGPQGPQGPAGQNAVSLWAYVAADGTLLRGSHVVSSQAFPPGVYRVTFDQNVDNCAFVATNADLFPYVASAGQLDPISNPSAVDVVTYQVSNPPARTNDPFSLAVIC